jgi:hypothetical protein
MISFGTYPEVSLKSRESAGMKPDGWWLQAPTPVRCARRSERRGKTRFMRSHSNGCGCRKRASVPGPSRRTRRNRERLEAFVFPYLGKSPIADIKAPEVLAVLKRIESRGKMETTHRVRSDCGNIFRYAVASGRAERDPTIDLRGAIAAVAKKNRPAIVDPKRIGELMRAIDGYRGDVSTEFALRLLEPRFDRTTTRSRRT